MDAKPICAPKPESAGGSGQLVAAGHPPKTLDLELRAMLARKVHGGPMTEAKFC